MEETPRGPVIDEEIPDWNMEFESQDLELKSPVAKWKIIKLIKEYNGIALADLCWKFQIQDREDRRLWDTLDVLLKENTIKEAIGISIKSKQLGKTFLLN